MPVLRLLLVVLVFASALSAPAQAPPPPSAAELTQLVRQMAEEQLHYLQRIGPHFRYHLHRVDPKEDTLRDVIETTEGPVARLLQHNGQLLTQAESDGDRNRLAHYISSGDLRKKMRDEKRNQVYGIELIHAMPEAMLYTLTPGQPQLPQHDRPQLVLDYAPNPQFHPTSTAESLLSGITGRIWVDAADHHLVRLEVQITRNLDIAMGLLARVYSGGTVEYDQRRIADDTYAYTHLRMHLRLRELMVKTAPYDSDLVCTDIQLLTPPPTAQQAIDTLLSEPVPTR